MARKQRKKEEWENNMVETKSVPDRIVDVIVYFCVALVAFCSVIPMWHVLMSSFSDGKSLLAHVGLVLWPVGGFTLSLSGLATGSLVGILLNAVLPGKDYNFEEDKPNRTGVNFEIISGETIVEAKEKNSKKL